MGRVFKGTNGDWEIKGQTSRTVGHGESSNEIIVGAITADVAHVQDFYSSESAIIQSANAKLIAAAPKLLRLAVHLESHANQDTCKIPKGSMWHDELSTILDEILN